MAKKNKNKTDGAAGTNAATREESTAAQPNSGLEYYLRPFTLEVRNDNGWFGAVEPYTLADIDRVVTRVEEGLRGFGPYQVEVKIATDIARVNSYDALKGYAPRTDKVAQGSTIAFKFADGSLECLLYVGKPEVKAMKAGKLDEEDAFLARAGKMGWGVAEDAVVIGMSTLAGGALLNATKFGLVKAVGTLVARGGQLYGAGSMLRRVYDETVPTGHCTLELKTSTEHPVTKDQHAVYNAFVRGYKK